jgi:hypothetical protein
VSVEKVSLRAQGNIGLGDLGHRDSGLHARSGSRLLQKVLQRQRVHDRSEHAHIVGSSTIHAALRQLRAAEEVAASHDDRDLDLLRRGSDLASEFADHIGIHSERAGPERLTRQFQKYSASAFW